MFLRLWVLLGLTYLSLEVEINITNFKNCHEFLDPGEEWPIEIKEVYYDSNEEGYIDQIHGTYLVRTVDQRDKELSIKIFKCPIDHPPPCDREMEQIIVDLHCENLQNDDSGIWYMVSQAMINSTCGSELGLFEFKIPRINHEYFAKYLMGDEISSRYKMDVFIHKKNDETQERRGCADIQFDIYH